MRDSVVRTRAEISLRAASRKLGISDNTIRLYEADPSAVRNERVREKLRSFYAACRTFITAVHW